MDKSLFSQAFEYINKFPDEGVYETWFKSDSELQNFLSGIYQLGKVAKPQEFLDAVVGGLYIGWVMHILFVNAEKHGANGHKKNNDQLG